MTQAIASGSTRISVRERLIVALDVSSAVEARRAVGDLAGRVGAFKIGLQLFTAAGPIFVKELCKEGHKVFLDLKFHDIPSTVANAGVEAARLGVWMFNLHAAGGLEMMSRAVGDVEEAVQREGLARPKILAVTVLTSSNANTLRETGIVGNVDEQVGRLVALAACAGLDGVVASPHEAEFIRSAVENRGFLIITPGVRPILATGDDQKRVSTPAAALLAGADYLVVGRPIMNAEDRAAAVEKIMSEIENESR